MRKINLLLLLALLLIVACGGIKFKKENGYYVDEKINLKFKTLGEGWERQDSGAAKKNGMSHFFFNKEHHARIWIRAIPYENDPTLPLKEGADRYVDRKAKQYSWIDLHVVAEDFSEFNGVKSFWKVYEYQLGSKTKKEKIYRVYYDNISYQFRFRCSKERFDALLPEFDAWLGSIEFIK